MIAIGHGIGAGLVQVLLALFVAFFLYRDGEQVRKLLLGMVTRLAGPERGGALLATAQSAVRGVVYGLIGTALVQGAVAFVGFADRRRSGRIPARRADVHPLARADGPGDHLGRRGRVAAFPR